MATVVYLLCALTSTTCAVLLARGYRRSRTRLLLWSAVCFGFLALNNMLLVIDLAVWHDVDLSVVRTATALTGLVALLYGLIFDTDYLIRAGAFAMIAAAIVDKNRAARPRRKAQLTRR